MIAWWCVAAGVLLATPPPPSTRLGAVAGTPVRARPGARASRWGRVVPAAAGLATLAFLAADRVSIMVAVLMAAITCAYLVDEARSNRATRSTDAATAEILGHVTADLRAGTLIGPAFARAVDDLPDSAPAVVRERFTAVATHVAHGSPGHEVLAVDPAFRPLARMWALAESHGLPFAPLMEQARRRLVARARHRSATAASLQGPQATAVILAVLPAAGIALGAGMGADPLGVLLSGGWGGGLLVAGTGLTCAGLVVSRIIIARAAG